MQKYYKVNSLAGSGKTHGAIRWALEQAEKGEKVVIAQPSRILLAQTYADTQAANTEGVPVRCIYAEDNDRISSVRSDVMRHLQKAPEGVGEILLITHATLMGLPYFHRPDRWTVIVDEIPGVDRVWAYRLTRTHGLITDHVTVEPADPDHYRVVAKGKTALADIRQNVDRDEIWDKFSELSDCLLSRHWHVAVKRETWNRYISGEHEHGEHVLHFYALLQPTIFADFKRTIIMGAMFGDSLLNLYWLSLGVEFEEHQGITRAARYADHGNGGLLTVYYGFSEEWSKNLRNKAIDVGDGVPTDVMSAFVAAIKHEYIGKQFAWVANNDVTQDLFGVGNPRLPNVSHGLNSYQHIDHVVFLSALNRTPAHYRFLAAAGLDPDWVRTATGRQTAYQAVMRGSLRDPSNTRPKTIVVPDRKTAEYIASYFVGCKLAPLMSEKYLISRGKPGRPAKADSLSEPERAARARYQKRKKQLAELLSLRSEMEEIRHENLLSIGHFRDENRTEKCLSSTWTKHTVSLFTSIYSAESDAKLVLSNEELIAELRNLWSVSVEDKTRNILLASVDFDPNKSPETKTKRGIANINYVNGIWLDNDGGDLSWQDFRHIFPDYRLVVFNTYSGGNRWRAFFPTSCPMTVEVHQSILKSMAAMLTSRGYYSDRDALKIEQKTGKPVKRHGFDVSKFVPCSLFYLPCQAKNPADSFFEDLPGEILDPADWIAAPQHHDRDREAEAADRPVFTPPAPPRPAPTAPTKPQQKPTLPPWTGIDDCGFVKAERVDEHRTLDGEARYSGLFRLALSMIQTAKAKYDYTPTQWEIEKLVREADEGHADRRDKKRIPTAVASAFKKAR